MNNEVEKGKCPHCGKTAIRRKEIKEKFGCRDMGDGCLSPQS
jgi:predicted RNA-binding Zn-ribbon protein involved in translation (DUF1610 family)